MAALAGDPPVSTDLPLGGTGTGVDLQPALRRYFVGYAVTTFGTGLVYPLTSLFLIEQRGLGSSVAAGYFAVFSAAALAVNPGAAWLAGQRGPLGLLVAGLVGQATSAAMLMLSTPAAGIYLAALVGGVGGGACFATQTAALTRLFGLDALSVLYGRQYQISNVAMAVAAVLAGGLVAVAGRTGYLIAFAGNAVSFVVFAGLLAGLSRWSAGGGDRPGRSERAPGAANPFAPYLDPAFLPIIGLQLCLILFGLSQLDAVIPVVLRGATELPVWAVTGYVAVNCVTVVLTQPAGIARARQLGPQRAIALALALWVSSFGLALMAGWLPSLSAKLAAIAGFAAVFGLGEVLISPSMQPLAATSAPAGQLATYTAATSFAYSLGRILGPVLLLTLYARLGGVAYWLLLALGASLGFPLLRRIVRADHPAGGR